MVVLFRRRGRDICGVGILLAPHSAARRLVSATEGSMLVRQPRSRLQRSAGFGGLGVLLAALLGAVLGGAEAAARVQRAERTEPFPRDESRRAMRLGPMQGD
ncbi:MAG: hypothetical protein RMK74_16730, partial [Myxococcales bacterium]|nr:hypothetical protein [Myxococcales bacterium]